MQALRYWATACRALYQIEGPAASDDFGLFDEYGADVLNQWYAVLVAAGWPAVLPPTELAAGFTWL